MCFREKVLNIYMDEEFREYTDDEVREILKNALKTKMGDNPKISKKDISRVLTSHISQFLACYKIIGYDLNGRPVVIDQFDNKLEKDALEHLFMESINRLINERMT